MRPSETLSKSSSPSGLTGSLDPTSGSSYGFNRCNFRYFQGFVDKISKTGHFGLGVLVKIVSMFDNDFV